jgi:glyoxylase-like metal-dependent hydrolase (beta-lactamase superfamily II)
MGIVSGIVRTWRIGEVEITRVLEHESPFVLPSILHPDLTPDIVDRHRSWLEPHLLDPATGKMWIAFHSFVIKTPHHLILADTCTGNDKTRPHKTGYNMKSWPYLETLASAGYHPEQFDYVLCTHLHADHVGWNTRLLDGRWVPTFPRARYLMARQEWEYWSVNELRALYTTDPYYEDSILPVIESGQADFVPMDHVIDEHVRLEPSPGHTPGHVCVRIHSGGAEAVIAGDIMHTAVQCAEPDINSCFCIDPAEARRMRWKFLESHAGTPVLVMPCHFPTPTAGWVRSHGSAFRFHFDHGPGQ